MENHAALDKAMGNGSDLWYGRMFYFFRLFDIELINKAITLDGESLKRIFDLSSFKEGLNSGEDFEKFFGDIPGVEEDLSYVSMSQAQHLYLVARFAALIYFKHNPDEDRVVSVDLLRFIFDKIDGANEKLWFECINGESDCFEIVKSTLDVDKS